MLDLSNWPEFTRDDFDQLIKANVFESIRLDEKNNLILIQIFAGLTIVRGKLVCTPDMPAHKILLELTGPLEVNRPKELMREPSREEFEPPESLEVAIFQCGLYNKVEVFEDNSIVVWPSTPGIGDPREHSRFRGVAYKIMLEKHLGALNAGDIREFVTPMPTADFEACFKKGMFKKVKMESNGGLCIWYSRMKGLGDMDHILCPPCSPHIQMLEKYFGTIEPGDIFEIPLEDLKEFMS